MEYIEAVTTVTELLGSGDDEYVPEGAIYLGLQAWKHLAQGDGVWDELGLTLMDVENRLHPEERVEIEAGVPVEGPGTRAAVAAMLLQLAQHYQDVAGSGVGPLQVRLDHDAAAVQLRRVAAVLG